MTSDERETFDDPRMSELLRAWGDEASRGQPLFRPPPELLRRVAEDDGQQDAPDAAPRGRWGHAGWLALAAAGLLAAVLWWTRGDLAPPPALAAVYLSTEPTPVREGGADSFRSGDPVFLHFQVEGEGWATVVRIDPSLTLSTPLGEPRELAPGANVLGPLELDERTGLEALILLTRAGDRADLEALVARAAPPPPDADLAQRLRDLLEAWRADPAVSAEELVFEHLPR